MCVCDKWTDGTGVCARVLWRLRRCTLHTALAIRRGVTASRPARPDLNMQQKKTRKCHREVGPHARNLPRERQACGITKTHAGNEGGGKDTCVVCACSMELFAITEDKRGDAQCTKDSEVEDLEFRALARHNACDTIPEHVHGLGLRLARRAALAPGPILRSWLTALACGLFGCACGLIDRS
eukprot:289652-Chlamydomonas_euryale.AAC.2